MTTVSTSSLLYNWHGCDNEAVFPDSRSIEAYQHLADQCWQWSREAGVIHLCLAILVVCCNPMVSLSKITAVTILAGTSVCVWRGVGVTHSKGSFNPLTVVGNNQETNQSQSIGNNWTLNNYLQCKGKISHVTVQCASDWSPYKTFTVTINKNGMVIQCSQIQENVIPIDRGTFNVAY